MRKPTTEDEARAWWRQALEDKELTLAIEYDWEDPKCGFFEGKMSRGGIMMPARIWIENDICPVTGELLDDEVFWCEHGGQLKDPYEQWMWLAQQPITEEYYLYLMARGEYSRDWAPHEPAANPFKKVDFLTVPTPTF